MRFISHSKELMNYENLPIKRKIRFWIHLPLVYLNKRLIMRRYRKWL